MKFTFYLKDPKSKDKTLIMFRCFFKNESKSFFYSTGEYIHPKNWNAKEKFLYTSGNNKAHHYGMIRSQLNRYSDTFEKWIAEKKLTDQDLTSDSLRGYFDVEFKKVSKRLGVIEAYELYITNREKSRKVTYNTVKNYTTAKNTLKSFADKTGYKLTFESLNEGFYQKYTEYCIDVKNHINDTFNKNITCLKTFLRWACEMKYTYNNSFEKFERLESQEEKTGQVVFTKDEIMGLMKLNLKGSLERVRDAFVFECVTGMRFSEFVTVRKENIRDGFIHLREEKGRKKSGRNIPISPIAEFILKKYDYQLPKISNQKYNTYIKLVCEKAGHTQMIERTYNQGELIKRTEVRKCDLVTTHSGRRTFVTILKNEFVPDKLIGEITGQTAKTINKYYKVSSKASEKAVQKTFNMDFPILKKA